MTGRTYEHHAVRYVDLIRLTNRMRARRVARRVAELTPAQIRKERCFRRRERWLLVHRTSSITSSPSCGNSPPLKSIFSTAMAVLYGLSTSRASSQLLSQSF